MAYLGKLGLLLSRVSFEGGKSGRYGKLTSETWPGVHVLKP